jgi:hypothetical protein
MFAAWFMFGVIKPALWPTTPKQTKPTTESVKPTIQGLPEGFIIEEPIVDEEIAFDSVTVSKK